MTSSASSFFEVQGSGKSPYTVTVNYDTGHWCTCPGMISKKKTWQDGTGRTRGTSCKHISKIIEQEFGGDWGTPTGKGKSRKRNIPTSTPTAPSEPTGRRAAIMAQRARRERETIGRRAAHAAQKKASDNNSSLSLLDRIAALESAKEGAELS